VETSWSPAQQQQQQQHQQRQQQQLISGASIIGSGSSGGGGGSAPQDLHWSSADRLNVSVGLLYALCAAAQAAGARAGFCVPRPQLLKRWLQAGVKMRQVQGPAKLIYPPSAHDYVYYKGSTVAFFLVEEVRASLEQVLSVVHEAA
jgi:hypothetical protein